MSRSALFVLLLSSCGGTSWMAEPLPPDEPQRHVTAPTPRPRAPAVLVDAAAPAEPDQDLFDAGSIPLTAPDAGRKVGLFRNTYYDFPREADYTGATLPLMSSTCGAIASVPRAFFESLCVQGSGTLRGGKTVSFARRDCECAEVCPRTGHRICFEALDRTRFPWGRGAAGRAITPLRTVAADTSLLPLGTPVYIPDFDGVPRREGAAERHDGCFVVEDRGVRIVGEHVDVFTGHEANTAFMNRLVPSNKGVTVIANAAKCERLRF